MGRAIEEMAAESTVVEEVESLLWKYASSLSERDIRKCLEEALANHLASIKFVETPRQ